MRLFNLLLEALFVGQMPMIHASVQDPSIAPRPPMGFNNWARFQCDLNQTLFTTTAEAMVDKGLLAAGYNRINLDDCWLEYSRAPNGSLVWNSTLFPNGLIWLGEFLHNKGFHFGIYQDAGNLTCGGYPGSKGYEELDAKTFASWGIDYLKMDGCNVVNNSDPRPAVQQYIDLYAKWHEVLSDMEHPFVFSESAPAYFSPDFQDVPHSNNTDWYHIMNFAHRHGELARHSNDISVYATEGEHWESILTNYGYNNLLARYQRCGFYNDPDFLEPNYPDLSIHEMKSHFALWSSFSAPLIISTWIPELKLEQVEYLTNSRIIEIDQDALCLQATLVSQDGTWDVLTKSLSNGDRLLTVLNRGNATGSTSVPILRAGLPEGDYTVTDLWTGEESEAQSVIELKQVPSHGTEILRISPSGKTGGGDLVTTPTGMIFNTFSLDCLTATNHSATFNNCTGSDSQVWQVTSLGHVSPLSDTSQCLTSNGLKLGLESCAYKKKNTQTWTYGISGNLIATTYGKCLAQGSNGSAVMQECGFELDSQVFGLPSGVVVVEGK